LRPSPFFLDDDIQGEMETASAYTSHQMEKMPEMMKSPSCKFDRLDTSVKGKSA
jgi:hypothetical protein